MHRTIAALAMDEQASACRGCAVLVSSRAGGAQLRSTLENLLLLEPSPTLGGVALPRLLTRDQWYAELHARAGSTRPRLSDLEGAVLLHRAARETIETGLTPPFRIGPGLVDEMLALYDALRRNLRTVDAFERLLVGELEPSREVDRGAERLLRQTHFLVAAFRAYERSLAESDVLDEERLREQLRVDSSRVAFTRVVVTIPDVVVDAVSGLWPADFDLLTRLHGLQRIDVVVTDAVLEGGLRERLDEVLPGIEEVRPSADARGQPTLLRPPSEHDGRHFLARDREEELIDVARHLKRTTGAEVDGDGGARPVVSERVAVVFQRPLPYLYLARTAFEGARVPYQAVDALPLAAEPFAAALDLVFEAVETGFARGPLVELLGSPHLVFEVDGERVSRQDALALGRLIRRRREPGGRASLERLLDGLDPNGPPRSRLPEDPAQNRQRIATLAALELVTALESLAEGARASVLLDRLLAFLEKRASPATVEPNPERHLRAHAAIVGGLTRLRDAFRRFGDVDCSCLELAAQVRRWVEAQTFAPKRGATGVQLVDVRAARYGDFDEIRIVGVVEDDWPARPRRNVFYPPGLLTQLGWPGDTERLRNARAELHDLLRLPVRAVSLSAFALDGDRLVSASPLLELPIEGDLTVAEVEPAGDDRFFVDDAMSMSPVVTHAVDGTVGQWLAARLAAPSRETPAYRGTTSPKSQPAYSVTSIEQYIECPFKYFSRRVLRLEEEAPDELMLSALERGRFIHDVLRDFFAGWQASGRGAITPASIDLARAEFVQVVDRALASLPASDRPVERRRLLGSAAAAGLCERLLRLELERPGDVVARLVEYTLDGDWLMASGGSDGESVAGRRIGVRGKADRIDLMTDGRLWVLDYKSGLAPDRNRAVQLPIYAVCAEQRLRGHRGRNWTVGGAAYVPLAGRQAVVRMERRPADVPERLHDGQVRFLRAVDGIEAGRFPPRPAESTLCDSCAYPAVCRKEFVDDA